MDLGFKIQAVGNIFIGFPVFSFALKIEAS